MNFCQAHWDELKAHIDRLGLGHLVAANGEEAAAHVARDIQGNNTVIDFDPLMGASMSAYHVALNFRGGHMLIADPATGRPPCPICALRENDWCEGAAYQALYEAKRRGLVNEEQPR